MTGRGCLNSREPMHADQQRCPLCVTPDATLDIIIAKVVGTVIQASFESPAPPATCPARRFVVDVIRDAVAATMWVSQRRRGGVMVLPVGVRREEIPWLAWGPASMPFLGFQERPVAFIAYDVDRCEADAEFAQLVLHEMGWTAHKWSDQPPSPRAPQQTANRVVAKAQVLVVILRDRTRPAVDEELRLAKARGVPRILMLSNLPGPFRAPVEPELARLVTGFSGQYKEYESLEGLQAWLVGAISTLTFDAFDREFETTYSIDEARARAHELILNAGDRGEVSTTLGNWAIDESMLRYFEETLPPLCQRGVRTTRIFDRRRYDASTLSAHIQTYWRFIRPKDDDMPTYRIGVGDVGRTGALIVDQHDAQNSRASASLYLTEGGTKKCLYHEGRPGPTRRDFVDFVAALLHDTEHETRTTAMLDPSGMSGNFPDAEREIRAWLRVHLPPPEAERVRPGAEDSTTVGEPLD